MQKTISVFCLERERGLKVNFGARAEAGDSSSFCAAEVVARTSARCQYIGDKPPASGYFQPPVLPWLVAELGLFPNGRHDSQCPPEIIVPVARLPRPYTE